MRSTQEWRKNNWQQCQSAEEHQRNAQLAVGEAVQVGEEVKEIALKKKGQVDRKLLERVQDLEFNQNELKSQKEISVQELDNILVYNKRVQNALAACTEPLAITRNCIQQRERRIGIELVDDAVNRCLKKEERIILQVKKELRQTIEQTEEQVRLLRATQYALDKELSGKEHAIGIDRQCTYLTPTSPDLKFEIQSASERSRTIREWAFHTKQNILSSDIQVKQSRILRSNINMQLHRVYEDITSHYEHSNREFNNRIAEIKNSKMKLENELAETTRQANIVRNTITKLEEPMHLNEQHIALVSTRLSNRALRRGIEQCRDTAELQLEEELQQLHCNIENLRRQQEQAEANLRCLRRTIEKITEEINKKINTLLIDEVECMSQRLSMHFHVY